MYDELYFTSVFMNLKILFGMVRLEDHEAWEMNSSQVIKLHHPRLFLELPGANPNEVRISLRLMYGVDTPQEELLVCPDAMELIGKIENNQCTSAPGIWNKYTQSLDAWRAQKANLVAPTVQDMANVTRLKRD